MLHAPCLNCKNRHPLCHSECKEYLEYRKLKDEENERLHKLKYEDNLTYFPKRNKRKR